MPRPKSEDRRAALLAAAIRIFAERGLGAPTAAISAEARVAQGSFFTYFKTKDELINVLYRELKLEQADAIMGGFPRRATVRLRMEHLWTTYVTWGCEHPLERRALKQLAVSKALTKASHEAGWAPFIEVERMTRDAVAERLLRKLPEELVVGTLGALAEMTMDLISQCPDKADGYRAQGFDLFWSAVTTGV
jgi:AcrR family transcriptional regulator